MKNEPRVGELWKIEDVETVETPSGSLTVYMRTLGALEHDARMDEGMSAARYMRYALKNPETVEYRRHMAHLDVASRASLEDIAALWNEGTLVRQALQEVFAQNEPEPPPGATITEVLETEEQVEAIEEDVREARAKWVKAQQEQFRNGLAEMSDDDLRTDLQNRQINACTQTAFQRAYSRATVYYACYKDKRRKKRLFDGIDAVAKSNPDVVDLLAAAYARLDRWTRDAEDLKKSPVDQSS